MRWADTSARQSAPAQEKAEHMCIMLNGSHESRLAFVFVAQR